MANEGMFCSDTRVVLREPTDARIDLPGGGVLNRLVDRWDLHGNTLQLFLDDVMIREFKVGEWAGCSSYGQRVEEADVPKAEEKPVRRSASSQA